MSNQTQAGGREESRFEDSPVSRRGFLSLSAATAGALALPGAAVADVDSEKLTDRYAFVVNHTDDDYEAATLIRLAEEDFDDLSEWAIETTADPEPAAYARLTTAEVEEVVELEGVEQLEFAPGSNPFWKLESYSDRVFFDPEESVDYVSYRETVAGMSYLADEHSDRLAFDAIGETHGHNNLFLGEQDPQEVWVAELTNDRESTFEEKPKAVFTIGIHGDERAGVEAGVRLIEEVLRGKRDDLDALLDEIALVFVTANPDGWVARKPEFESRRHNFHRGTPALQRGVDEADVEEPPWDGAFHLDSNRQYPSLGWIDPINYPGEPEGAPQETDEQVPDASSIVSHLRGYEQIEYVADYHGMQWADHFVLSLIANGDFDLTDQHALDEMHRRVDLGMADALGSRDEIEDAILASAEQQYADQLREPLDLDDDWLPPQLNEEGLFDWGTIYDTLSYQVGGALLCWAGQPEENGGLGARTIAPEMSWSNTQDPMEKRFIPEIVDVQATAYQVSMTEIADLLADEVEATIETDGKKTAYVTSEALTRSSEDLVFTRTETDSMKTDVAVEESETIPVEVPEGANSLDLHIRPEFGNVSVTVRDPDGEAVVEMEGLSGHGDTVGCACMEHDETEQFVCDPAPGEWVIEIENEAEDESAVSLWTLVVYGDAEGVASPDPADVLGYEQREYEASPFEFFEDHDAFLAEGKFEPVTVEEVCRGELLTNGTPAYENVVVIHDDGKDTEVYTEALDEYVKADGNLVLTDSGVSLLGEMDTGIESDDVEEITTTVSHLAEKEDHPLLDGVREIEVELWKPAPLGYPITNQGAAPTTVIDPEAFENAGGTIAGWLGEDEDDLRVTAGSINDSVHVIGGLLPPAEQRYLHPFGLLDYCLSYLSQTLLLNALGYEQRRTVDGEDVPYDGGNDRAALPASE